MKQFWALLLALALFLPGAGRAEKADSFQIGRAHV